jgi:signal transduction histidine kinase
MAAGATLTLLATALVGVALRARNQQEVLTEQIREARDALAAAQQERNKISRDLHDGTIQSLYAIQLGLGHTVQKLEADPAKAGRGLSAVRRELDIVIAEIRQFITAEAGADKPVDFSAVLNALVQRAQAGITAQISLHCAPGASGRLTGDHAVQLANIAREALSNSLRHARPQEVQIVLRSEKEKVVLEIVDDGGGFDPKAPGRSGMGLTSMLSRAREMGGTLETQSSPGKGTHVVVRVPAASIDES